MTRQTATLSAGALTRPTRFAWAVIILGVLMIPAGVAYGFAEDFARTEVLVTYATLAIAGAMVAGLGLLFLNNVPAVDAAAGQRRLAWSLLGFGCLLGVMGSMFAYGHVGIGLYLSAVSFLAIGLFYGLFRRRSLWPVVHTAAAFGFIAAVPWVGYVVHKVTEWV